MDFIIKRKITICMLFIAISLLGYVSYKQLKVEMLPNAELPMLFVRVTSDKDVTPAYMESQGIIPLEGVISTIEGVENIEATARNRQGEIRVDFKKGINLKYITLKLQERVNSVVPSLPDGFSVSIERANVNGVNNNFMTLQIRGTGGVDRLRAIVDKDIKPQLENIDGVAAVNVFGGREKAIEIRINEESLQALKLTPARIRDILAQYNQERTFLGYINTADIRYYVHLDANYDHISQIENIIVAPGPIYLKDVADIFFDMKEETTLSRVNGKEAISVALVNDAQVNLLELSNKTKKRIEALNEEFMPHEIELVIQSNSADEIEKNIDQVVELGISGALLAIIVLWFFLRNIHLVFFIALSMPISILAAFNLFYYFDISINSLTLIGMVLAIGMLLDNSIVVLENIYRLFTHGKNAETAVTQGTREVWKSIFASTLTTITVFLPFIFSNEVFIRLIGEHIGVSIIATLLFSLTVALLLIPMTTYVMLKKNKGQSVFHDKLSINQRSIQIYTVLLKTSLRKPAVCITGCIVVLISMWMIVLSMNTDSSKPVNTDRVNMTLTMPSSSTLEYSDRMVAILEEKLDSFPEKKEVICRIQEDAASISLVLKDDYHKNGGRKISAIVEELNKTMRLPNVDIQITTGSSGNRQSSAANMMNRFMSLLGVGDNRERIVIKGSDFDMMDIVADNIRYNLREMDFVAWNWATNPGRRNEVHLIFDPILLASYNITRQNIVNGLSSLNKELATNSYLKLSNDDYAIVIKEDISEEEEEKKKNIQKTIEDLRKVMIPDANGGLHELQQIASIRQTRDISSIRRVNREREITIYYGITQAEELPKDVLNGYRDEIDQLIAGYNMPSGIAIETVRTEESLSEFNFLIIASLILIFMILASVFESVSTPFVLLFTIPLAAIGSLLGLFITGNNLMNANTMTGFLILLGVVVNNGIILIDYSNILRRKGYSRNRALITSGYSRLRPILITTATTVIAMLPMAMGDSDYAGAIGAPFAVTVIGGLSFSALLTLILIPTVYLSLENILKWYRSLSRSMHLLHLAIYVAGVLYVYFCVYGVFTQLLYIMALTVLIPGCTYFIKTSIRVADNKIIDKDDSIVIEIRNLVKIYDWSNKFARQWESGIKLRKRLGLHSEFHHLRDFVTVLWQVVVYLFLLYMVVFYLDNKFWIIMLAFAVCAGFYDLWKKIKEYLKYNIQHHKGVVNILHKVVSFALPVATLMIICDRIDNVPATVVIGFLWALGIAVKLTSDYLYVHRINIERLTGRFAETRRTIYTIIKSIPIIGKRRTPFKALKGVSFSIKTGMFGLLGPNGAGKSTMMRIVTGILEQSYGTVWINGLNTKEHREELQSLIGFLPQEFGMYESMTSWEFLDYQAMLKGITDPVVRKERLEYVLKAVHMYERKDHKIGSFSGGMKQRIGIALILLHLPRILVVDEPTAGLDPRERIRFRNLLVELSRDRIVIFSTHIIEDIASSCNQVAVINRGELKYYGDPLEMIKFAENKVWVFDVEPENFDALDNKLIVNNMMNGDKIRVRYISVEKPYENAERVEANLEDAYLCLLKNL
ncbi:MAG: ATP-binding cassette domain-containing protein [Bacteroidales bacterium]|nr:ATP-binding cassette domain-containing protein [Bacteroidales bacterium]